MKEGKSLVRTPGTVPKKRGEQTRGGRKSQWEKEVRTRMRLRRRLGGDGLGLSVDEE